MVISDEKLTEFMEIYKATYGEEISKEEAWRQAIRLICLVKATYKPIPKDQKD